MHARATSFSNGESNEYSACVETKRDTVDRDRNNSGLHTIYSKMFADYRLSDFDARWMKCMELKHKVYNKIFAVSFLNIKIDNFQSVFIH